MSERCLNITHEDVKFIASQMNISAVEAAAKISLWQDFVKSNDIPTVKELKYFESQQSLKRFIVPSHIQPLPLTTHRWLYYKNDLIDEKGRLRYVNYSPNNKKQVASVNARLEELNGENSRYIFDIRRTNPGNKYRILIFDKQLSFTPEESTKTKYEILQDKAKEELGGKFDAQQFKDIIDTISAQVIKEGYINETRRDSEGKPTEDFIPRKGLPDITINNIKNKLEAMKDVDPLAKDIVDSWDVIKKAAREDLLKLNKIKINEDIDSAEGLEDVDFDFAKTSYQEEAIWATDVKFKISTRLKSFLSLTYEMRKELDENDQEVFTYVRGYLSRRLIPVDITLNKLKSLLSDLEPSWDIMKARLEEAKHDHPFVQDVLYKLEGVGEYQILNQVLDLAQVRKEFVTSMTNTSYGFETVLFNEKGKSKVINTNRHSLEQYILNEWITKFRDRAGLVDTVEGELSEELKTEILGFYKSKINNKQAFTKADIDYLLPKFGISIDEKLKDKLANETIDKISPQGQWVNKNRGIFAQMILRLEGKDNPTEMEAFEMNNPLFHNSGVKKLAKLQSEYKTAAQSQSLRDGKGNMVNLINQQRSFDIRVRKLKSKNKDGKPAFAQSLLKVPFLNNNGEKTWLDAFARDDRDFIDNFSISFLDTLKEDYARATGIKPTEFERPHLELTKAIAFHNQERKVTKLLYAVPGKGSLTITLPRLDDGVINENGLTEKGVDALYGIVKSEVNRINAPDTIIAGYNPKRFYFYPQLDEFIINGKVIESEEFINAARELIKDQFELINKEKRLEWELDQVIVNNKIKEVPVTDMDRFIASYNYNYLLGNYNIFQVFIGDPALFAKGTVEASWDNISKRLTKEFTSGTRAEIDLNRTHYINVALKESYKDAINLEELIAINPAWKDHYSNIKEADAQKYSTYSFYLHQLLQLGLIKQKEHDKIKAKIKKGEDLTESELKEIKPGFYGVMKPVETDRRIVESTEKGKENLPVAEVENYIKSAMFPLLPQFTRNTPLDKVREKLEALEENKELNNSGLYVTAAFESANKLGAGKTVDLLINEGVGQGEFVVTSYEGFRIQTEIPYDPDKGVVDDATQPRKLIKTLIKNNREYTRKDGSKISGKDLKKLYEDTYRKILKGQMDAFADKYVDERGFIKDEIVSELLQKEAKERDWDAEMLKSIVYKDGEFTIPLMLNSSDDIEKLLSSIVTNKVLKIKRTGKSYTAVSEYGLTGYSSDIIYSPNYDGKTGLKSNQLILPSYFAKQLPYSEVEKDGVKVKELDLSQFDEDTLKVFGFRIPNSGYNLMGSFEIVGFMDSKYGDTVIYSRNLIAQMSMDNDADKLYIYRYDHKYDSKFGYSVTDTDHNILLDLTLSVLNDSEIQKFMMEPLNTDELKEYAKDLKSKSKGLTNLRDNFFSDRYAESVDAGIGIGSFATAVTLASQLPNVDREIYFLDSEGERNSITFSNATGNYLNEPYTLNGGRTKFQVLSKVLQLALDNDKEPLSGILNINKNTFNAIQALVFEGFDLDVIIPFINNKYVKEYIRNLNIIKNSDKPVINPEKVALEMTFNGETPTGSIEISTKDLSSEDTRTAYYVVKKYIEVAKKGDTLHYLKSTLNIDSKYLSKSMIDNYNREYNLSVLSEIPIANVSQLVENEDGETSTIMGHMAEYGLKFNNKIWSNHFRYRQLAGKLFEDIKRNEVKLNKDLRGDLLAAIKLYTYSNATNTLLNGKNKAETIKELLQTVPKELLSKKENSDNIFLQLLNVADEGVTFNNSAQNGLNEGFIHNAVRELILNDPEFAHRLFTLALLTNPVQSTTSYIKFIPMFYYETLGLTKALNKALNILDQEGNSIPLFKQIVQHLPKLAKRFDKSTVIDPLIKDAVLVSFAPHPDDLKIKETPILFKSYYDDKLSKWMLYQYVNGRYERINLLGDGKKRTEYDHLRVNIDESIYSKNYIDPKYKGISTLDNSPHAATSSPKVSTEVVEEVPSYVAKDEDRSAIDRLKDFKSRVSNRNEIIDILIASGINPTIKHSKKSVKGTILYNTNTITINPSKFKSEEDYIDTMIEELIHSLVGQFATKEYPLMTPEEQTLFKGIEGVRNKIIEELRSETNNKGENIGKQKYSNFISKWKKHNRGETVEYTEEEIDRFYPVGNNAEFIAHLFKNKGFQNYLNGKQFTEEKSILQRLVDLITKFLNSFRTIEGKEIVKGNALEASLKEVLTFLNEKKLAVKRDNFQEPTVNKSTIKFEEESTSGYRNRTIKNASADATIAIAVNFNSAGEKLTKNSVLGQNKKYIAVDANTLTVTEERVNKIVEMLNSVNAKSLNIAGNGIYTMKGKYTQQQVDDFTYELLNKVINSPNLKNKIESIRTGGQTGFDEAGTKAGIKLGIPTLTLAPKGWTFRNIEGKDISNEQLFKARFNQISNTLEEVVTNKEILEIQYGLKNEIEYKLFSFKDAMKRVDEISSEIIDQTNYIPIIEEVDARNHRIVLVQKQGGGNAQSFTPEGTDKIDDFAKKLQEDINFYKRKINFENNPKKAKEYEDKMIELTDDLDRLIQNHSLAIAANLGKKHIQEVTDLLNDKSHNADDLQLASRTLLLWQEASNLLLDEESLTNEEYLNVGYVKDLRDVQLMASNLYKTTFIPKARVYLAKMAKNDIGYELTVNELFGLKGEKGSEKEIGGLNYNFRAINTHGSPLASMAQRLIDDSNIKTDTELYDIYTEYDKKFDEFRKSSFYKQYGYDGFVDENGDLHTRTSKAYYKELNKRRKIAMKINTHKAWVDFYNWIWEQNNFVDVRKLYKEEEDGTITKIENPEYIAQLEKLMGKSNLRLALYEAEKKINNYSDDLKVAIESYETSERPEVEMDYWKKQFSPFVFFDNMTDPKGKIVSFDDRGKVKSNKGLKYVYGLANKEWVNPEFEKIANDDEASKFYDWFVTEVIRFYRILPNESRPKFNQLPPVSISFAEELSQKGVFGAMSGVTKRFLDVLKDHDLENPAISQDRLTNKIDYNLVSPISGKKFLTKSERNNPEYIKLLKEIESKTKTKDLGIILKTMAAKTVAYKHKKSVEGAIKLIQLMYSEQYAITRNGELIEGGLVNTTKAVDYAVAGFFGVNPLSDPLEVKSKRVLDKDDEKVKEHLEKMLVDINEKIENKETPDKELEALNKEKEIIEGKIEKLGKVFNSKKAINSLIWYNQLKSMGWGVGGATANLFSAFFGNSIEAAGGEYFNNQDLKKGMSIMLNSTKNIAPGAIVGGAIGSIIAPGFGTFFGAGLGSIFSMNNVKNEEGKKISNLMKKFKTLGNIIDGNDMTKDYNTNERKWYSRFSPFEVFRMSEFFSQGTTMTALMMHEKVTNLKGKEVPLYYAFDSNGKWKVDEFGENADWDGKDPKELRNFIAKFYKVKSKIHGNLNTPIPAKGKVLGRAFMQFRSWMPETIANRIEPYRKDWDLNKTGADVEGRWRMYFNFDEKGKFEGFNTEGVVATIKGMLFIDNTNNTKGMKPYLMANLNRNIRAMQIYSTLLIFVLGLKLMDEDDEEEAAVLNFTLNTLFRVQSDLQFYSSPTSIENINRSVLPLIKTVGDFSSAATYGTNLILEDNVTDRQSNVMKGKFAKIVPAGSAAMSTSRLFEDQFDDGVLY